MATHRVKVSVFAKIWAALTIIAALTLLIFNDNASAGFCAGVCTVDGIWWLVAKRIEWE